MNSYDTDRKRLQLYLPQLRGCAGFSAEDLASKIGITKQAISYIETHQDKPMTKMQYIAIRAVFDEEYSRNPKNINLRDCYDLVFSSEKFYEKNKERIEYALYQAVEDTKNQKKKNRAEQKKEGIIKGASLAGATAATIAIGGIAAATFPVFCVAVGGMIGQSVNERKKELRKELSEKAKEDRSTERIVHSDWMSSAFDSNEK